jgi:hypothetical protein
MSQPTLGTLEGRDTPSGRELQRLKVGKKLEVLKIGGAR